MLRLQIERLAARHGPDGLAGIKSGFHAGKSWAPQNSPQSTTKQPKSLA
jgi:hypothetical protein